MSQDSCNAVYNTLIKRYASVKITTIDNLLDLDALVLRRPDLVFLGMTFIPMDSKLGFRDPNKIWIAAYFDEHGIAYTGSAQAAHELQRDKPSAKRRVLSSGLMTSQFFVIKQDELINRSAITLKYPLFVKPKDRGGGLGIDSNSVAYNFEQLAAKVRSITAIYHSDSIVEEYLPGREFSVAILKNDSLSGFTVMPIELVAPVDKNGIRILSNKVKTSNAEQVFEVINEDISSIVNALAINVFLALGGRDYGRIDIRLDEDGVPNFLEANLIPSLISSYGSFPKACMFFGIDFVSMIMRIVELGLSRCMENTEETLQTLIPISDVMATPSNVAA